MARTSTITVRATDSLVARYKHLLVSEWERELPDQVLSLLWSSFTDHDAGRETASLPAFLNPELPGRFSPDEVRAMVRRIGEATRFLELPRLPALPADYQPPRKPSKTSTTGIRLASYLTLQGTVRLAGAIDFFHHLQALAFQAAIHFVLPSLKKKHPAEHALLLHALLLFPLEFASDDVAQYSYALSMIHGYLGNAPQRLRCLLASFHSTPPQDHSFLTKAQEVWSEMLDDGQYQEAEKFLFLLPWRSLPSQQEEVRQMLVDGMKYILADGRERDKASGSVQR